MKLRITNMNSLGLGWYNWGQFDSRILFFCEAVGFIISRDNEIYMTSDV